MGRKSDLIENLVMEVLVARCVRMGESRWPFPTSAGVELRRLAQQGMVTVKGGIVQGTLDVSITDLGRAEWAPDPLPDAQAANLEAADDEVADLLDQSVGVLWEQGRHRQARAVGEARRAWYDRVMARDDHTDHVHVAPSEAELTAITSAAWASAKSTLTRSDPLFGRLPVELRWVFKVDTFSCWELVDDRDVRWGWAVNGAAHGQWTAHVGDFGRAATLGESPPPFEDRTLGTYPRAETARSWVEEWIAQHVQAARLPRVDR